MKIVKIYGGLGNQMFQYAFARGLAEADPGAVSIDSSAFEIEPAHNGYELARVFRISLAAARRQDVDRLATRPTSAFNKIRKKYLTKKSHFIDKKFSYQSELLSLQGERYYEGYWQSELYFAPIADIIREEFSFRESLSERNRELLAGVPRPVASLHVRRGDYVSHGNLNICTPSYYERAIETLSGTAGIASLLVFSDDAEYCRANIGTGGIPTNYVDWNAGTESWQDMAMMSLCDNHVIANSSFSWWGAWLDPKAGKRVLAPTPWNRREIHSSDNYYVYSFDDIVPSAWERIAV